MSMHNFKRVAQKPNAPLDCRAAPMALFHDGSAALHAAERMRRRCPLGISAKPDVRTHSAAPVIIAALEAILGTA